MQVLTAQYPLLYVHKFRVSYQDFQASTLKYKAIKILDIAKTVQVLFVQFHPTVVFAGSGITQVTVRLHQAPYVPAADSSMGQYAGLNVGTVVGDTIGTFVSQVNRQYTISGAATNVIGNVNAAYSAWLTLNITGTGNINNLSTGSIDIWIGVLKLP